MHINHVVGVAHEMLSWTRVRGTMRNENENKHGRAAGSARKETNSAAAATTAAVAAAEATAVRNTVNARWENRPGDDLCEWLRVNKSLKRVAEADVFAAGAQVIRNIRVYDV